MALKRPKKKPPANNTGRSSARHTVERSRKSVVPSIKSNEGVDAPRGRKPQPAVKSPTSTKAPQKTPRASQPSNMRRRAGAAISQSTKDSIRLSLVDTQRLLQELRVHQIELEMQNEQLRQASSDLARSRDRVIDLYDRAPVGYMTLALDGIVEEANLTLAAMLGVKRQNLVGNRFAHFVTPASAEVLRGHPWESFNSDRGQTCELLLRRADGIVFPAWLEILRVQASAAQPAMLRITLSDITERKQNQEALQRAHEELEQRVEERTRELERTTEAFRTSEERLRLALEGGDLGSWDVDVRTGLAQWNRRHALMLGHEPVDEPETMDLWRERVHPDDLERVMGAIEEAKRTHGLFVQEHRLSPTGNGDVRWLSLYGRFSYDEAGEPVRFSGVSLDVTDRKQAEVKLLESEARFRSFFENAAVGAAQINASGRFVDVNSRFCQITGYSRDNLVGKMGPLDLDHPDEVEADRKRIANFFRNGTPYLHYEKRYVRKDGQLVWVRVTVGAVRDAQGIVQTTAALIEDITERKLAEAALQRVHAELEQRVRERTSELERSNAALRASEEKLHLALRAAHMGTWHFNLTTSEFTQDGPGKILHGFAADEPISVFEVGCRHVHRDDIPDVQRRFNQAVEAKGVYDNEYRVVRPDGSIRWIASLGKVVGDGRYLIGMVQDITEKKEAAEALLAKEAFLHDVLDSLPAHVCVLDKNGFILRTNGAWAHFAAQNRGVESPFMGVGQNYLDVCRRATSDGDSTVQPILSGIEAVLARHQQLFSAEYACHSPEEQRWFLLRVAPLKHAGGVVLSHVNITERKWAEARLEDLTAKLLTTQEGERKRIARELHDDFTQRLAALAIDLRKILPLVLEADTSLAQPLKQAGEVATQLTTELQRLAHDLHPSILEHLGLEAAVREQVEEFTTRTGLTAEVVVRNVPASLPLQLTTCLYRVLQESLQNVRKHAEATTVMVRLIKTGQGMGLCIHDDGRGFKSLPDGVRPKGLGLTSMDERVRALGGKFRVKSNLRYGTEVHAWLPLNHPAALEKEKRQHE